MAKDRILAMVLAGGEGTRLAPLTAERSKPAVPFGGRYRIVDFVLSNLVNSEIYSIYILVQYRSQSLIEHIRSAWVLAPIISNHFVTVVPPQMAEGSESFAGTADAIFQNLSLIRHENPTLVAVFGADHIYRMDVSQMIAFHRSRNADVTVAALPVPSVIRLLEYRRIPFQGRALSRKNILVRDRYTCQYCHKTFSGGDLTLDHVIPRSRAGETSWENMVACCHTCNNRKGSRTPEEAGMRLLRQPRPFSLHTSRHLMRLVVCGVR